MSQIQPTNRFTVKRLGALDNATIDIKPLTILCGRNNTGKTWLMYSLYSFIRSEISQLDKVNNIIRLLKENGNYNLDVSDWVRNNFDELRNAVSTINKKELSAAFNADDDLFNDTTISWDVDLDSLIKNIELSEFKSEIILGNKEDTFFLVTKKKGRYIELMLGNNIPSDILNKVISSSIYKACLGHCKDHRSDAFIIPAERNGLHLFYRELSNRRTALLHHASRKELDLASLLKDVLGSKYARPIADYIDWLNSLVEIKNSHSKGSPFHHVAEEIKKLIGGKYEVNNDGNIEYIPKKVRNKPSAPKLDLHLSSSTIKSLFGIWFYLEYQAKENSTLMIDEPELNLHPSNQRVIARIIAKLINSNINVIVSTHSDYFIRELNSLIMLGSYSGSEEVKNQLMKKYGFSSNELLSKEKIAAYVFKDSTLNKMEVGFEGILANTFDEEINKLNESSDDIYYSYILPSVEEEGVYE